jgi:hypothetical protein
MFAKLKALATAWAAKIKHVFTTAEAFVKTAAASIVTGGITAVTSELHSAGQFAFTLEHLLALKAAFIAGSLTGFFLYLADSPVLKKLRALAPDEIPAAVPGNTAAG